MSLRVDLTHVAVADGTVLDHGACNEEFALNSMSFLAVAVSGFFSFYGAAASLQDEQGKAADHQ